jgi:PAS domain S-box-containing protein
MTGKSKADLVKYIAELENKLFEAEETIQAIKYDKIDALVISTTNGERIYTLNSADRPYRIFLEQMNEGAITVSFDGIILFCNRRFSDMVNIPLEHLIGNQIKDLVLKSDLDAFNSFLAQNTDHLKEEIRFTRPDGSCISLYLSLTKLSDSADPVLCVVATDLTEKKQSEEILAAEKLARSILDQAGEAIVVCDDSLRIIRASKAADKMAGETVLYNHFDKVFPMFDQEKNSIFIKDVLKNLNGTPVEVILLKNEKDKLNVILNIGVLSGQFNNVIGYVINLTNITQHIQAEEQLQQSLKEKTLLLKEIHHRVKNNLQIISSLLRLQSLYVSEDHLLGILNECQNRINSMALIHQQLYESKSFATISFNEYLKELVRFLSSTYLIRADHIELIMPKEDITFSIDVAVPLGLVINELVTNSFKHAFPDKRKGVVEIKIDLNDTEKVHITLADNGVGIPKGFDFFNPTSLGLQLVHSLIDQISGTIELQDGEGTIVSMRIPKGDL